MPEIVLVRHGETMGKSSIRLYGATDVALAPEGEAQVAATGVRLRGRVFDRVFASSMSRALRSAAVLLATMEHPPAEVVPVDGFREIDFGRWEGWTWAEVADRDPEGFARWEARKGGFTFPEGDASEQFQARVQAALGPTLLTNAVNAAGGRTLVVAHKGVIKAIASALIGPGATGDSADRPEHARAPEHWALPLACAVVLHSEHAAGSLGTWRRVPGGVGHP